MMNSKTEIAWAAGFFDGEGTVVATRCKSPRNRNWEFVTSALTACNYDLRSIKRLKELFGGTIYSDNRRSLTLWVWKVTGQEAEDAARAMMPYTSAKFEQLELFLELRSITNKRGFNQTPERRKRRGEIADEIKSLKLRT